MQAVLGRQVTKPEAAQTLGVTRRSIDRYVGRFQEAGPEGLYDRRHSNHRKLDEAVEYQYLARRLGIERHYAQKPRTKGKIENQFRFVQRDFVLENLHQSDLSELNAARTQWMEWYNWQHRHKGLNVWAILKGETIRIECGKEVIATHQIKTDYLRVFPRGS